MTVRGRKMETVFKVLAVTAIVQLGVQCSMDANAAWKSSSVSHFNVSSVIRHKRYLDFLPKSRMFVSIEHGQDTPNWENKKKKRRKKHFSCKIDKNLGYGRIFL